MTEHVISEELCDTEYVFATGDVTGIVTIRHRDHYYGPPGHADEGIYIQPEQVDELIAWLIDHRNAHLGVSIAPVIDDIRRALSS